MKLTREQMMDALIRRLGMEHSYVVFFCTLCEDMPENDWNNTVIYGIYQGAINHNWEEE